MKKGLLSILASALLVVGCQNYDDQFSALETQINALASTVAGLSQVQSDLSSLAGTVNSLASTVNGLGTQIDTAVSDGLSDIQADITAIETAVADVASSEDVAAIDAALDTAQSDLTDLLAASSVFTGDVVVNSVNTLDAYLAMGAALNIVNGNVDITVSTTMDQTKVQSLVNNILTVVKDFKYTSAASTIAETTFDNLTGVQSLTITQGGGMRFPNLVSATVVRLNDDFESTVGVIHFGSLTSVTSFQTDAVANTIQFTKATELHLTSLKYYPGGVLTLETDEGAAMPFALDDIDADGDTLTAGLTLTITGPASFASSQIADGTFDFTDVKSVNLTDYKGAVTIGGDVESFTSNSLVSLSVDALTKVETIDVTGAVDPDATAAADKLGPAISLSSLGDLETVKIAGIASSVTLSTNNNLTSATISADVSGAIQVDNNSDLTTLTVTGATASALDVDTNADLTAVTVDLTWGNSGTGTTVDGDLDVTGNTSLETLTVSSDGLENLEVTANTSLATLDFTGVTKIGATGTAVVNIYNNDLTATKLTDATDGTTDVADGGVGDLGSVTSTSGMSTLKTYLTAVDADADSAAAVYWDKVESFLDSEAATDVETTDISYSSATAEDATTILLLTANTADTGDAATSSKRSFLYPASTNFEMYVNGATVVATGTANGNANQAQFINAITTDAILAAATAAGATMTATANASPSAIVAININSSAMENSATAASNSFAFGISDTFTLTIDGLAATITATATGGLTASTDTFVNALMSAWNTAHALTAAAARWTIASAVTASGDPGGVGGIKITATASDPGSREIDAVVSAAHSTSGNVTDSSIGIAIGNENNFTASAADNKAQGNEVLVTLTAATSGDLLGEIGNYGTTQANAAKNVSTTNGVVELSSTYNANITASNGTTVTDLHVDESRLDVVLADEANAAATSNAKSFSRVGWLG